MNDPVWDALKPALRLAAKILEAEPPYWKAILDIYTLRPVDRNRVPRDLQDQEDNDLDVSSLWLDVDPEQMWPEARALYDTSPRLDAVALTTHLLEKWVYFSIAQGALEDKSIYVSLFWGTEDAPSTTSVLSLWRDKWTSDSDCSIGNDKAREHSQSLD